MNQQRLAILIAAGLGALATFMPWIRAPFIGTIAGSQGDGWYTLALFSVAIVVSLLSDKTKRIEGGALYAAIIPSIIAALIGIQKISYFSSMMADMKADMGDNPFAMALGATVSIEFGLYLLVLAGLAVPALAYLINDKQKTEPRVNTNSRTHDNEQGTETSADGDTYTGGWEDGERSGQGTETWHDGTTYTGGWKDDEHHGQGTVKEADGTTYTGEWRESEYNGQGTMMWTDGRTYTGEFRGNMRTGQGTYTYANGDTYTGEFKDGNFNGQGTYTDADGGTYIGEWDGDLPNGQGTETAVDGTTYTGEWKDGERNGQGTETLLDGTKRTGEWKDGEPVP